MFTIIIKKYYVYELSFNFINAIHLIIDFVIYEIL